jgi:hypothetical protein
VSVIGTRYLSPSNLLKHEKSDDNDSEIVYIDANVSLKI